MSYNEDKTGQTVNSALCAYTSLNQYNKQYPGTQPPVPSTTMSGCYVVPLWKQTNTWAKETGYQNLVMGRECGGYPTIMSAYNNYGMDASNCNPQYGNSPCMDGANCGI